MEIDRHLAIISRFCFLGQFMRGLALDFWNTFLIPNAVMRTLMSFEHKKFLMKTIMDWMTLRKGYWNLLLLENSGGSLKVGNVFSLLTVYGKCNQIIMYLLVSLHFQYSITVNLWCLIFLAVTFSTIENDLIWHEEGTDSMQKPSFRKPSNMRLIFLNRNKFLFFGHQKEFEYCRYVLMEFKWIRYPWLNQNLSNLGFLLTLQEKSFVFLALLEWAKQA